MQIRSSLNRVAATALAVTTVFGALAGVNVSSAKADQGNDARCANMGYYLVASDGGVFTHGDADFFGSLAGEGATVVGIAPTASQQGYWLALNNGEVRGLGDARALGNVPGGNVVGIAGTHDGNGYWAVNGSGSIFTFGNAPYLGGFAEGKRIVGIVSHPTAMGYWIVASDGSVRGFGAATVRDNGAGHTDMSYKALTQPIVGMSSSGTGNGYWLVGADGGIFTFGDALFFGSTGAMKLNKPVVAMTSLPSNQGYYFVAADGGIFTFGQSPYCGSEGDLKLNKPIVGMVLQQKATVSSPPATSPPATSPPATSPPATSPPATSPPATSPPATSPPATSPPATSPPATSPPATSPPATSPPTKTPAEQCIDGKLAGLRAAGYEPGAPVAPMQDYRGGKAQHFSNKVTIFHHSTFGCRHLQGDMQVKYNQLQQGGMVLGFPTTDITAVGAGAQVIFETGIRMYWYDSAIGAKVVYGSVLTKYLAVGGPTGIFGFPRTDEANTSCGGARYNQFQSNRMIVASGYGTFTLTDWMYTGYHAKGGSCGFGLPSSDSQSLGGKSQVQHFSHIAALYFDGGAATYTVRGAIYKAWKASMTQSEWFLGYPKGEESLTSDVWAQQFQLGGIYINHGNHFVKSNHNATYLANGGIGGWLGAPTGSTHMIGAGTANPYTRTYFQNGRTEYFFSGNKMCHYKWNSPDTCL